MDPVEAVIAKLETLPHVISVHSASEKDFEDFFALEGTMESDSGMIMRNNALIESMKRTHHLVVVQDEENFDPTPFHSITWETEDGVIVAYDVPDNLRYEVEGRDDLIWVSDDFAMEPVTYEGDIILVMHPMPVNVVGTEEGVKDAIGLYPASPVDLMMRERLGIKQTGDYATCILSFNLS